MTDAPLWTLDELVQLARQALAVDYDGPPSARVRDLPDRRLVRWYVTRGLVDRPAATNGRNALYGRRHLLQLVAIKRRQAQGLSLAQIQGELAGATDPALEQAARLAMSLPSATDPTGTDPTGTGPTDTDPTDTDSADADRAKADADTIDSAAAATPRPRFWVERPAAPSAHTGSAPPRPSPGADRPLPPARTTWPLQAIELSPGITLLVDATSSADVSPDAVRIAAQPLLDLLVPATTDERSTS
jgi:DNA-binding transcriptional MerR regulator